MSTLEESRVSGPIEGLYTTVKGYLPKQYDSQILKNVGSQIVKVTEKCDGVIRSAIGSIEKVKNSLASTKDVKNEIILKSKENFQKIGKGLFKILEVFGLQIQAVKENTQDVLEILSTFVKRLIQINFYLAKSIYNSTILYVKNPSLFLNEGKEVIQIISLNINALFITLRSLVLDITNQIMAKIGAQIVQTKKYFKLVFKDLKNPQRMTKILSQKLINFKNVSIKTIKKGIEIAVDKKHYQQNVNKITATIIRSVGQILMNLQDQYDHTVFSAKQLYEKTVKNYKIQKILLQNKGKEAPSICEKTQSIENLDAKEIKQEEVRSTQQEGHQEQQPQEVKKSKTKSKRNK